MAETAQLRIPLKRNTKFATKIQQYNKVFCYNDTIKLWYGEELMQQNGAPNNETVSAKVDSVPNFNSF